MQLRFDKVPVLQTERLELREIRTADFVEFAAMWADPGVAKYISGVVSTRAESWIRLMSLAGSWPIVGFGYWVITEKSSGRYVGIAGFGEMKRELVPSIEGQPEAGWVLAQWAHGRGFATEAMREAMSWGLNRFGNVKPVAIMNPENGASRRVAQKCGFGEKKLTTYKEKPLLIMEYQG